MFRRRKKRKHPLDDISVSIEEPQPISASESDAIVRYLNSPLMDVQLKKAHYWLIQQAMLPNTELSAEFKRGFFFAEKLLTDPDLYEQPKVEVEDEGETSMQGVTP